MGGNVDGLHDWSRSLPYVNLIRQGRGWGSPDDPWVFNVSVDPITGWPTSDFAVQISSEAVDMGGTYLLTAKGNATVWLMGGSPQSIKNKTYDPTTNTLTALVNVREGADGILLKFHNTTGPGLQNISLLQPGYNLKHPIQFIKYTIVNSITRIHD